MSYKRNDYFYKKPKRVFLLKYGKKLFIFQRVFFNQISFFWFANFKTKVFKCFSDRDGVVSIFSSKRLQLQTTRS